MLPTRLNLLPPDKQAYLHRAVFAEFIKSTLESVLFLVCLVGIGLLLGQWVLQGYFQDLTENTIAVQSARDDTSTQKIKKANITLKQTQDIQKNFVHWTPLLLELSEGIPENIILTKLAITPKNKEMRIAGKATTRTDLLTLRQSLESLPFVSSVDIPLSQLIEKENVSFSLTTILR